MIIFLIGLVQPAWSLRGRVAGVAGVEGESQRSLGQGHPRCTLPASLLAIGYSNTTSLSLKIQFRNLINYHSRIKPKYIIFNTFVSLFLSHQVSSNTNLKPFSYNIFSSAAFIAEVTYDLKINKLACKYKGKYEYIYLNTPIQKKTLLGWLHRLCLSLKQLRIFRNILQ